MKKNVNLGALAPLKQLSKNEQQKITGGAVACSCNGTPVGYVSCQTAIECVENCQALCKAVNP